MTFNLFYTDSRDRRVIPKFVCKTGNLEDISEFITYKFRRCLFNEIKKDGIDNTAKSAAIVTAILKAGGIIMSEKGLKVSIFLISIISLIMFVNLINYNSHYHWRGSRANHVFY